MCVRGGRDSGNQVRVFQREGRVPQIQDAPPPLHQESKMMTVMASLDLAPKNISRRDRSHKGQRRGRRNWGAMSEGVGGQETLSRRRGDQRIGSYRQHGVWGAGGLICGWLVLYCIQERVWTLHVMGKYEFGGSE